METEALLKVEGINVYYGAIHAIKDISFQVNAGEIVTLIGANGAGKTGQRRRQDHHPADHLRPAPVQDGQHHL